MVESIYWSIYRNVLKKFGYKRNQHATGQRLYCIQHTRKATNRNVRTTIPLLNAGYKILTTCIKNILTSRTDDIGTCTNVVSEVEEVLWTNFIHYEKCNPKVTKHQSIGIQPSQILRKSYDTVKWKELYETLEQLKVSSKVINLIKMVLQNTENRVELNGKVS